MTKNFRGCGREVPTILYVCHDDIDGIATIRIRYESDGEHKEIDVPTSQAGRLAQIFGEIAEGHHKYKVNG